jgi:hypothetical protein
MNGPRVAAAVGTVALVGGAMVLAVAAAAQRDPQPGAAAAGSSGRPIAGLAQPHERGAGKARDRGQIMPTGVPASQVGKLLVNDTGDNLAFWPRQARGGGSGSISYSGGILSLSTSGVSGNGYSIISPHTYTSGIFEARVYFPGANDGKIADWPAFWLSSAWSGAVSWPDGGEMDLAEGMAGRLYVSYHYGVRGVERSIKKFSPTAAPGWHTITGVWKADEWDVYYDGKMVKTMFGSSVRNDPMNVILSAYQGNLGNQPGQPSTLRVSYLRIWSLASS